MAITSVTRMRRVIQMINIRNKLRDQMTKQPLLTQMNNKWMRTIHLLQCKTRGKTILEGKTWTRMRKMKVMTMTRITGYLQREMKRERLRSSRSRLSNRKRNKSRRKKQRKLHLLITSFGIKMPLWIVNMIQTHSWIKWTDQIEILQRKK